MAKLQGSYGIIIRPTIVCPQCERVMIANEKLLFLPDDKDDDVDVFEFDMIDEMLGTSYQCAGCGYDAGVVRINLETDRGDIIEY